jgi:hypothetical protein
VLLGELGKALEGELAQALEPLGLRLARGRRLGAYRVEGTPELAKSVHVDAARDAFATIPPHGASRAAIQTSLRHDDDATSGRADLRVWGDSPAFEPVGHEDPLFLEPLEGGGKGVHARHVARVLIEHPPEARFRTPCCAVALLQVAKQSQKRSVDRHPVISKVGHAEHALTKPGF